jgi:hypothetical protein
MMTTQTTPLCKDCSHCIHLTTDPQTKKVTEADKKEWQCDQAPVIDILDGTVTYQPCSTVRIMTTIQVAGKTIVSCGQSGEWFEQVKITPETKQDKELA